MFAFYTTKKITIKWYLGLSSFFTISNGFKQRGILSQIFLMWLNCKFPQITNWLSSCRHLNQTLDVCWWPLYFFAQCSWPVWENLQISVPSMANCLPLRIMSTSLNVWLSTANPRTWKIFIVTISIIVHYLIHCTMKCKYLGHIINNNLTDDDNIARQNRWLYAQANVSAKKIIVVVVLPQKLLNLMRTVLQSSHVAFKFLM